MTRRTAVRLVAWAIIAALVGTAFGMGHALGWTLVSRALASASRSAEHSDLPHPSGSLTGGTPSFGVARRTEAPTPPTPLPPGWVGVGGGVPLLPALLSAGLAGPAPSVAASPRPTRSPSGLASAMVDTPGGYRVRAFTTGRTLRGVASFVAPGYGARYLALPAGPGLRVRICGPAACVTRTSTDAGPDLAMQRAGRVADVSFADFRALCDCDPWAIGVLRVTVAPIPAPPETTTGGQP